MCNKGSNCVSVFILFIATVTSSKVKVAVYEHVVISPDDPEGYFTRQEAFQMMSKNLEVFENQAEIAAKQGAKLIVFPEYGITGFDHSRNSILPFLEDIPDATLNWNPCDEPDRFDDTMVLHNLSCIAKVYRIYLVANMGDLKRCDTNTDESCPQDGRFQFNTNVVFNDAGKLIARYHKLNMYDETPLFDPSPTVEYVYFDTPFGKFGTVICFDILHNYPTQVLLKKYGIRNLLVTSAMNVFIPFLIPQQMFSGIAKMNHVNVIASNVRNSLYQMAGSGIFGDGIQKYSNVNYTSTDGMLLFAEIETEFAEKDNPPTELSSIGDFKEITPSVNKSFIGTYHFGLNMSYSIMEGHSGFVVTCKDDVCCAVTYQFKHRDESEVFILSAVDEAMYEPGIIHMQYCAVFKCSRSQDSIYTCSHTDISVKSVFADIKIQGYFDNGVVFPLVSTVFNNSMDESELKMDMDNYQFDERQAILYSNQFDDPLLAAVVFNTFYTKEAKTGASSKAPSKSFPTWQTVFFTLIVLGNFNLCL